MPIEPELLRVLIAFAESNSLVHAAERLRITQPAVTQRLNRLQRQVPMPLYAIAGRRKVLTHYGKAMYELAKESQAQLERGVENLNRRYARGADLVLKLGSRQELFGVFTEAIHFTGRVEHAQMTPEEALTELQADRIDILLSEAPLPGPDLISLKIFDGSSRFVFHRKLFPKAFGFREIQAAPDKLLAKPFVAHRTEERYLERLTANLGIRLSKFQCRARLDDWASLVGLVEQGLGYAVVPAFVPVRGKDLVAYDIPHAVIPRMSVYAVFHRRLKEIEAFQKALSFVVRSS